MNFLSIDTFKSHEPRRANEIIFFLQTEYAAVMMYLPFFICGIISTVLSMVWFGPLFGKKYRTYCDSTPEKEKEMCNDPVKKANMQKKMMKSAAIAFIMSILTAGTLSGAIGAGKELYGVEGIMAATLIPFFNWLGFVVPPTLGMVLWDNKKWGQWFLIASFWLVYMVLAGFVIVYL